jgi:hypothetical protein
MAEKIEPETVKMDAANIPFVGDIVPIIFADNIRGAMFANGALRLNLTQMFFDPTDNQTKQQHVATIVLPASQAQPWGEFILKLSGNSTEPPQEDSDGAEA